MYLFYNIEKSIFFSANLYIYFYCSIKNLQIFTLIML